MAEEGEEGPRPHWARPGVRRGLSPLKHWRRGGRAEAGLWEEGRRQGVRPPSERLGTLCGLCSHQLMPLEGEQRGRVLSVTGCMAVTSAVVTVLTDAPSLVVMCPQKNTIDAAHSAHAGIVQCPWGQGDCCAHLTSLEH